MSKETFKKLHTSIRLALIKSALGLIVPASAVGVAKALVPALAPILHEVKEIKGPAAVQTVNEGSLPVKAIKNPRHPRRPIPSIFALRTRQLAAVKLTSITAIGVFAHQPTLSVDDSEAQVDTGTLSEDAGDDLVFDEAPSDTEADVDNIISDPDETIVVDELDVKVEAKGEVEVVMVDVDAGVSIAEDMVVVEISDDLKINTGVGAVVVEVLNASPTENKARVDGDIQDASVVDEDTISNGKNSLPAEESSLADSTSSAPDSITPTTTQIAQAINNHTSAPTPAQDAGEPGFVQEPVDVIVPVTSPSKSKLNVNSAVFVPAASLPLTSVPLKPCAAKSHLKPLNAKAPPFAMNVAKQVELKISQVTSLPLDPGQKELEAKLAEKIALLESQAMDASGPNRPATPSFARPALNASARTFRPSPVPVHRPAPLSSSTRLNATAPTFTPAPNRVAAVTSGKENRSLPSSTTMPGPPSHFLPHPHPHSHSQPRRSPCAQPVLNVNAKPFSVPPSRPNSLVKPSPNRLDPKAATFTPVFGARPR